MNGSMLLCNVEQMLSFNCITFSEQKLEPCINNKQQYTCLCYVVHAVCSSYS